MNDSDLAVLTASLSSKPPPHAIHNLEDVCNRTGLDWRLRHVYLIERGGKWRVELSIDGFRAIAGHQDDYDGQSGPLFATGPEGPWTDIPPDKPPYAAKVGVRRKGQTEPTWAVAKYADYATGPLWKKFPSTMTAKCFDDRTEVLTDRGFQRFSEITGRVLQVTDAGLEATDAQPWSQYYHGPMVQLLSDDLNFVVTPNHDMITDQGRIEAGELFERARYRTKFRMLRVVPDREEEANIADDDLVLIGAVMADGSRRNDSGWRIAVSRPEKVVRLRNLGRHIKERTLPMAGNTAVLAGRVIETKHDQQQFIYNELPYLTNRKEFRETLSLSSRQARVLVDAWLEFDGSGGDGCTMRLHTSNPEAAGQFEVLAVHAGYAVSNRHERPSPGARDRITLSVSERDAIAVRRLNTPSSGFNGIAGSMYEGNVWCVTVPSGEIVVRRDGFSMRCGNCAEMLALRKAFPAVLGGLYGAEEMQQAGGQKEATKAAPKASPAQTEQHEGIAPDDFVTFSAKIESCATTAELTALGAEIQASALGLEVKMNLHKVYAAKKKSLAEEGK